jgi:phosphate-selective porin
MGQYKVPFSVQELTSDQRQEFIERAITNAKYAAGRDQGLMLWGTTADKRFGYQAAVFNGGGEGRAQDDQKLMSVARVWTAPFGEYKLSEGPLENTDHFVLLVGGAYRTGEAARGTATTGVFEKVDDESAWNAETAVRFWRLYGTAEYFQMTDEVDNPVQGPAVHSRGYHAQVGIMVIPKHLELAGRYAEINPDTDATSANVAERRFGATWYVSGHALKLQADCGRISYDSGFASLSGIARRNLPALGTRLRSGTVFQDDQYRLQAQMVF